MKKKVLILSSTPRKGGNSDILCDVFRDGAISTGHSVEKIFLKDKKIGYCSGCGVCYNGGGVCPQNDDMAEILNKMIESDVIVMATPVYFYTMSAQMKTLIDRTCSRYLEINNKEFYFIVSAADTDKLAMERTIEGFRGFTFCLNGAMEKGIILGIDAWQIGDIKNKPVMSEAYEFGRNI